MEETSIQLNRGFLPTVEVNNRMKADKQPWANDVTSEPDSDSDEDVSGKSTKSFEAQSIEFVIENDRRYCNETYFMPNDETEQTRLNIVHQIYLILLDGKLTTVPLVKHAPRILDIGTGPGDWAIEMSSMHPSATIIASDIGVFDNGLGNVDVPNIFFQLDDAQGEWTYHEPFDLIHLRGLSGAFADWQSVYQQAFRHLGPGGFIEIADADPAADTLNFPHSGDSYLRIFASAMRSAAEAAGYRRDLSHLRPSALTAAGFTDVRVQERTLPIGLWPDDPREKTLGKMALIAVMEGLEAYSLRQLTATKKWTADAVRDLCAKVRDELMTAHRVTTRVHIVTARKPFARKQAKERRKNEMLQRLMQSAGQD
ncbi:S-adenosyl-L-methionine-dependent methyltransferase [Aspergillus taichungensis]|uniref:S-adenosyl-L-methionine-dependent methyltransferase n=1 Tax=Aspergillus taichungensis TaxID=482145 RepID=A0A2J5HE33_9EURO|nr:S-adenosyl-L-methionine-dependent methyltransferase [Aspergillus taichungensis]